MRYRCQQCDTEFYRYAKRLARDGSRFCSAACRSASNPHVRRDCAGCGAAFYVRASVVIAGRGVFCSRPCYEASRAIAVVPCLQCGAPVKKVSQGKRQYKIKYCSVQCHHIAHKARKVSAECIKCGADMIVPGHVYSRGGGKYCSRACADTRGSRYRGMICEPIIPNLARHVEQS
jgi:hypothetical protein